MFPIYGSGQGAGNSPGIWCCISSDLFKCYESKAHGASFYSPDLKIHCKVFMIGFVDDTSGSTNDFLPNEQLPLEHYLTRGESDAQRWNDVLHVSGAALNDSKCSYHFLHYDFTLSGIAFAKGMIANPVISIKYNSDESSTKLKPFSNYAPHKTLGTWKAPAGNDVLGSKKLREKNMNHAKIIHNSPFNRRNAWTYYHSVYL